LIFENLRFSSQGKIISKLIHNIKEKELLENFKGRDGEKHSGLFYKKENKSANIKRLKDIG
jgi:hypothetical protein